jgi:hypothetical protein
MMMMMMMHLLGALHRAAGSEPLAAARCDATHRHLTYAASCSATGRASSRA